VGTNFTVDFTALSPVPEPSTVAIAGPSGLFLLLAFRRKANV
jgi:hypothetical protein